MVPAPAEGYLPLAFVPLRQAGTEAFAAVLAPGHASSTQQSTKKPYGAKNNCVWAGGVNSGQKIQRDQKTQQPLLKNLELKQGVGNKSRVLSMTLHSTPPSPNMKNKLTPTQGASKGTCYLLSVSPAAAVHFSSVTQSCDPLCLVLWLFVTPWIAAHQASLSLTNSWSLPKFTSIELVMPSNHLILCRPLLLPPSISSSIRVF